MENNNELRHHGVLGMKWGVRRYQNYDGTRIGKLHTKKAKLMDENSKLENKSTGYNMLSRHAKDSKVRESYKAKSEKINKKIENHKKLIEVMDKRITETSDIKEKTQTTQAKDIVRKNDTSKMTNEDLKSEYTRLKLEKDYLDMKRQVDALNPKQISKGEAFVNFAWDKWIVPAAEQTGKKILTDAGSKLVAAPLGKAMDNYAKTVLDDKNKQNQLNQQRVDNQQKKKKK